MLAVGNPARIVRETGGLDEVDVFFAFLLPGPGALTVQIQSVTTVAGGTVLGEEFVPVPVDG